MTSSITSVRPVGAQSVAEAVHLNQSAPIDTFLSHVTGLQNDSELLRSAPIILYDQCSENVADLRPDCFFYRILTRITEKFQPVFVLQGGFLQFQALYSSLCWNNTDRPVGEDVALYQTSDCDLERLLDRCSGSVWPLRHGGPLPSALSPVARGSAGPSRSDNSLQLPALPLGLPGPHEHSTGSTIRHQTSWNNLFTANTPRIGASGSWSARHSSNSTLLLGRSSNSSSSLTTTTSTSSSSFDSASRPSPILPHLVLGCQADAMSASTCQQYGITHVLNVSVDGPAPVHIGPERFRRIPVHDTHKEQMREYFERAFAFVDAAKISRGRVLIHCSAGISRSPTLAIAYLMHTCKMSMRNAYDFVKSGRATIAPNFNFLGQLLEFERELFQQSPPTEVPVPTSTINTEHVYSSPAVGATFSSPHPAIDDLPVVRRPKLTVTTYVSSSLLSSPKHGIPKKRDRPTYLSLDASPSLSHRSSMRRPHVETSPTEGKRSRVVLPQNSNPASLLPSPCTVLSRLELCSPSEDTHHSVPMIAFTPTTTPSTSSSSLDKLHFEPCQVAFPKPNNLHCSTSSNERWTNIPRRSTVLLAERRLTPTQLRSAPSTPQSLSSNSILPPLLAETMQSGSPIESQTVVDVRTPQALPPIPPRPKSLRVLSCTERRQEVSSATSSTPHASDLNTPQNSLDSPRPMRISFSAPARPTGAATAGSAAATRPNEWPLLLPNATRLRNSVSVGADEDLTGLSLLNPPSCLFPTPMRRRRPVDLLRHPFALGPASCREELRNALYASSSSGESSRHSMVVPTTHETSGNVSGPSLSSSSSLSSSAHSNGSCCINPYPVS